MNKQQIEVQKATVANEEKIIRELKQVYTQAKKDCERKIKELSMRTDLENVQSIIYQKQYQEAIKKQLESVLDDLNSKSFTSVAEYLMECYETGYIGTLYDLQGQGIPLIIPINQEEVVKAIQTDSKISEGLYKRMGEDTTYLKKSIRAELSRGISNGSSWNIIAEKIAKGMNSPFDKAYNNTIRIARTEGHRIQQESSYQCQQKAKSKGADVVKQWDSTLDGRTRDTHRLLDGQIKELDEPFEVSGMKAMYPGAFGIPSEDCNCRCCLLQRAKWALDKDELNTLKERATYFELDKAKDFEDFKQKYLKLPSDASKIDIEILQEPAETDDEHFKEWFGFAKKRVETYNPVKVRTQQIDEDEIIKEIAGSDRTGGSCASAALAYIGQKHGLNVLDFRGGESRVLFGGYIENNEWLKSDKFKGGILRGDGACSATVGNNLLKQCEVGKEYLLAVGRHMSIVRKVDDNNKKGKYQYLELQSAAEDEGGWTDFDGNPRYTLVERFGCNSRSNKFYQRLSFMIDVENEGFATNEFKSMLGYLNTNESEQMKGEGGSVK